MSDSVQPHRWQPTRLPRPWDSPGKNAGVGCHNLIVLYCNIRLEVIYIDIACACQQNNILTIELQIQTTCTDFCDEIYHYLWDCFIKL